MCLKVFVHLKKSAVASKAGLQNKHYFGLELLVESKSENDKRKNWFVNGWLFWNLWIYVLRSKNVRHCKYLNSGKSLP